MLDGIDHFAAAVDAIAAAKVLHRRSARLQINHDALAIDLQTRNRFVKIMKAIFNALTTMSQ
jgi:hypothetical protein